MIHHYPLLPHSAKNQRYLTNIETQTLEKKQKMRLVNSYPSSLHLWISCTSHCVIVQSRCPELWILHLFDWSLENFNLKILLAAICSRVSDYENKSDLNWKLAEVTEQQNHKTGRLNTYYIEQTTIIDQKRNKGTIISKLNLVLRYNFHGPTNLQGGGATRSSVAAADCCNLSDGIIVWSNSKLNIVNIATDI